MANSKFFAAALMVICAATACSKFLEDSNSYGGIEYRTILKNEKIVDRKADDARITLADNETFSFTENVLVENQNGEQDWRKGESFSHIRPFGAFGETVDTVYTDNVAFEASLISRKGSENAWEDGAWAGTQVDSTYSWSISNGEKTFSFTTVASASDAVFSCENYKEVTFQMLNRSVSSQMTSSEKMTVLNGKTYKETDFVHTSKYGFAVPAGFGSDSKSIELVNKLVVLDLQANLTNTIENEDYVLNLVAEGNRAYADVQKNSWDVVVYDYDTEVSRQGNSVDLALSAEASKPASITVKKDDLGKLTLRTLTHGANKVTKTTDGDVEKTSTSLDYVATFNGGNAVTISTIAESAIRGDESLKSAKIQNVRFVGAELASQSDANAVLNLKFDVDFETPNVATKAASNVVTKTVTVAQEQVAQDELVRRWGEGTATANGNDIDVTAKFFEEWTLSGIKEVNSQSGKMTATLVGQNGEDVVANDANFTTTSNGKVGTNNGTYSSTASNGQKSFDNNYTWSCDNSKTFTYEGVEVKFVGSFVISEVSSTIGDSSIKLVNNIAYDAYPYNNKVQGVYTVDNASIKLDAETSRNILVERVIPHIIPDEWGKPVSYGVSAVPAHAIGNGNYADGSGNQTAHKAHCFAFENGAVVVITTMNTVAPSEEQIIGGYFVEGNFKNYNSGVDVARNGKWIPAKATDAGGYLKYTLKDGRVRAISNETLTTWPSWGYKYSTVVDGYSYSISENGTLTVVYNGQVALQIR